MGKKSLCNFDVWPHPLIVYLIHIRKQNSNHQNISIRWSAAHSSEFLPGLQGAKIVERIYESKHWSWISYCLVNSQMAKTTIVHFLWKHNKRSKSWWSRHQLTEWLGRLTPQKWGAFSPKLVNQPRTYPQTLPYFWSSGLAQSASIWNFRYSLNLKIAFVNSSLLTSFPLIPMAKSSGFRANICWSTILPLVTDTLTCLSKSAAENSMPLLFANNAYTIEASLNNWSSTAILTFPAKAPASWSCLEITCASRFLSPLRIITWIIETIPAILAILEMAPKPIANHQSTINIRILFPKFRSEPDTYETQLYHLLSIGITIIKLAV